AETARADAFPCELLTPAAAAARSPRIRMEGLRAALWSPHEMMVDPRDVIARLPDWLAATAGVRFQFDTLVHAIDDHGLDTSRGRWNVDHCYLCTGDELQALYPAALASLGLRRCKLQMMRSRPMPWRLGAAPVAGLTLTHYDAFASCPSLPALKRR